MKTKILQFGEGNFLRCFIDWMVEKANRNAGFDGAVQIIQPIGDELSAPSKALNARGGRYHTCLNDLHRTCRGRVALVCGLHIRLDKPLDLRQRGNEALHDLLSVAAGAQKADFTFKGGRHGAFNVPVTQPVIGAWMQELHAALHD